MKKIFQIIFIFTIYFYIPVLAFAHTEGQPPFFKINRDYSDEYPIQTLSFVSPAFLLPQDIALEDYVVNEPIQFEIDTNQLQQIVTPQLIQNTTFLWDFGDGTTGTGLKNTHTYKKTGTYVVVIEADTTAIDKNSPIQVIQSTLFHIIPDKNFQVPEVTIRVNGQEAGINEVTKVKNGILDANLLVPVNLEAYINPPVEIRSVIWDLGDTTSADTRNVTHTYKNTPVLVSTAVRVITNDGYIIDDMKNINHSTSLNNKTTSGKLSNNVQYLRLTQFALAGFVIIILVGLAIKVFRKKNSTE